MKHAILLIFLISSLPLFAGEDERPLRVVKLEPVEFTAAYPKRYSITNNTLKLPRDEKRKSTQWGSKEFLLFRLTDPKSEQEQQYRIIVIENKRPQLRLETRGCDNVEAEWVDETVLKIKAWPGRCVQLVELINVESGEVLYRSATGIYVQDTE